MKLVDARSGYESFSSKASDIARQISLAGIGLIWIFKSGTGTALSLNPILAKAAFFIFLALLFDFMQYITGATAWFIYFRYKEKKGTAEADDFLAPEQLDWPIWGLFYLKCIMMLIAYGCYIIPFLFSTLRS